jgi:putative nucleotidyltransferase with HDIG domain
VNRTEEIVAKIGHIQPLPGTVLRLVDVINNPDSTVTQIAETIKYDQVLTARMLRICNSSFFSLSREVLSLEDAMRYLGTLKVLQMAMAIHSGSLLSRGQDGYDLEPGSLWKHSVAVAIAATLVAERTRPANLSLTFTAGLLHDIGKVVLNEYVGKYLTEIVNLVNDKQLSFDQAEEQVIGCTSAEVGGRLAEKWQLPDLIAHSIRYHRTPGALDPPDALVDTVHLADCVCMMCGVGLGSDGLCYQADAEVMGRYRLKVGELETIGVEMFIELKRVQDLFADNRSVSA